MTAFNLRTAFGRRPGLPPWLVFFFVVMVALFAAAGPVTGAAKRSFIAEVDGYAYLSEEMTLAQTRKAAFLNAKRQAVEMAQTYIQSHTSVENFVLKKDAVAGSAEGAVTVLEQKDLGVEDNTRYHVWIRAEVTYEPQTPAAGHQPMDGTAPLSIRLWSTRPHYRQGERIELFIQGNRDFHARIVDFTSDGNIVQLLPNAFRRDAHFKGGQAHPIPGPEDGFELNVSPPFGRDQIVVYASEAPLGEVGTEPLGRGLSLYRGSRESLATRSRGISVSGTATPPAGAAGSPSPAGAAFFEGSLTLTTGPP